MAFTLYHADCADAYDPATVNSSIYSRWWNFLPSNVPTVVASAGRFGRKAFRFTQGSGTSVLLCHNVTMGATIQCVFSFRLAAVPNTANDLIEFLDTGTIQVSLRLDANGYPFFTRNGTQIGNKGAVPLDGSTDHSYEVLVTIDPSAGVVRLRKDGVDYPDNASGVMNYTGLNTRATSNSSANQFQFGKNTFSSNNSFDGYMTDLVLFNNTGTLIGDVSVPIYAPNGNGTYSAWTNNTSSWAASTAVSLGRTILDGNGNIQRVTTAGTTKSGSPPTWATTLNATTTDNTATWTCLGSSSQYLLVNEPFPDDDISFISSNNVGDKSTFTYPTISGSTLYSVVQRLDVRKTATGGRSVRGFCRSAGTDADSGTDIPLTASYVEPEVGWTIDPHTGSGLTVAAYNAGMEFGVKLTV